MVTCFDSCWNIIRHSYRIFKTQQFFWLLAAYFSENTIILFLKSVKISTLSCSTCSFFSFLLFKFFQKLRLDENMLLLELRSLIGDTQYSPFRCKCQQKRWTGVNSWEPLLYNWGKVSKKNLSAVKCVHIWRIKDQLDVTCYFISLRMYSTCFGH